MTPTTTHRTVIRHNRHRLGDTLEIMGIALDDGDWTLAQATARAASELLVQIEIAVRALDLEASRCSPL